MGLIGGLRSLTVLVLLTLYAPAQDVATIIQRSIDANKRDWEAAPRFDNSERDRTKDGDKTYAVTMLFGSPCQRLIAINGQPLNPAQQRTEDEKFAKVKLQRQRESPEEKSRRIAKYEADRKRDSIMMEQMTTAFDFRLLGDQTLNGREVYVLKATPRRSYQPPNRDSKVLTGMEGTLWIDHETFQWVKVEAHVTRPVSIEGFLAEVEPGTQFELEKEPVSEDVWLASHFSMKSAARVMHFFWRRGQEDDTYFDYHKTAGVSDGESSNNRKQ